MITIRKSIALVLLGMLFSAAAILLLSNDSEYQSWSYHYFREDYAKAGWVYDRIIKVSRPTDNLFMGSSHVYNGVDDEQIAKYFGSDNSAYNAAIPTSARNLQYVVIRDILEHNKPRRLFLELRETEERTSHFGFSILARIRDAFDAPISPWWIRDVVWMLQHRFEYLVSRVLPPVQSSERDLAPTFGFLPNTSQRPRDQLESETAAASSSKRWRILPAAFGDLEFRSNKIYVEYIAKLCRENNIELHFLYLPFFGAPKEPMNADFYRKLGTLHLLPEEIATNLDFWADETHLNPKGAKIYTQSLIDYLNRDKDAAPQQKQ